MKTIVHSLLVLLFAFFCIPSSAASNIERIQATLAKPDVLCGHFEQQKKLAGVKSPVKSSGRFCIDIQKGILWRTQKPFSSTLKLTRSEITQFNGNNVTMKLNARQEPMVKMINNLLFSVMSGDLAQLEKLFTIDSRIQQKKWKASLRSKNANLAKVIDDITMNGDSYIRNISISERNGDRTFIVFSGIQTGRTAVKPDEATLYQ